MMCLMHSCAQVSTGEFALLATVDDWCIRSNGKTAVPAHSSQLVRPLKGLLPCAEWSLGLGREMCMVCYMHSSAHGGNVDATVR